MPFSSLLRDFMLKLNHFLQGLYLWIQLKAPFFQHLELKLELKAPTSFVSDIKMNKNCGCDWLEDLKWDPFTHCARWLWWIGCFLNEDNCTGISRCGSPWIAGSVRTVPSTSHVACLTVLVYCHVYWCKCIVPQDLLLTWTGNLQWKFWQNSYFPLFKI